MEQTGGDAHDHTGYWEVDPATEKIVDIGSYVSK